MEPDELNNLGVDALMMGRLDRAIDLFDQALALSPDLPGYLYNRGNAYSLQGNYQEAIADYNRAIELDPNFYEAYVHLGQIYQDFLHQPENALTNFTRAIAINPHRVEALHNRSLSYQSLGRLDAAFSDLTDAIVIEPDNFDLSFKRGLVGLHLQKYHSCIRDMTAALELNPNLQRAYLYRADAEASLSQLNEALTDYSRALDFNTGDRDAIAWSHLGRATILEGNGEYQAAFVDYDRAHLLRPDVHHFHHKRGWMLVLMRQFTAALDNYDRAITLDRERICGHCYHDRGLILTALERHEEAIADANYTLTRFPNNSGSYLQLAVNKLALKQIQGAVDNLNLAIYCYEELKEPKKLQFAENLLEKIKANKRLSIKKIIPNYLDLIIQKK